MKQHLRFQENGESLITKKLLFHLLAVFTVEPLVLTATWPKKYKEGFYPLVPGFKTVELTILKV